MLMLFYIMEVYVHVSIVVLDGKNIRIGIKPVCYTVEETSLRCRWVSSHEKTRKLLFINGEDVRCFECVPWGNYMIANQFKRIGTRA